MRTKKINRILAGVLSAAILTSPIKALAVLSDVSGHWAEDSIAQWQESGLIHGYEDGTFRPDQNVTRAEFVTIMNNAMGFQAKGESAFQDVKPEQWYYQAVSTAAAQGYCSGYEDNTFRPDRTISRQEAAVMLARVTGLSPDISGVADFEDTVSEWAKASVGAVAKAGYMKGYPDGTFGASKAITRAEAVVSIDKAMERHKKQTGKQDVAIEKSKTTLAGQKIMGNLIVEESVGEGEATIKNCMIEGDVIVKGGGTHSVYLEDVTVKGRVIVEKKHVKVQMDGKTTTTEVEVNTVCTLASKGLEQNVPSVKIKKDLGTREAVVIKVPVEKIHIEKTSHVDVQNAVKHIYIENGAENAKVMVAKGITVQQLIADSKMSLSGSGTVEKLIINANHVRMDGGVQVKKMDVASGITKPIIHKASSGGSSNNRPGGDTKPESPKPELPKPEPPKPEPPKPEPTKPEPTEPEPEPELPQPPTPEPEIDPDLAARPIEVRASANTVSISHPAELAAVKTDKFGQVVVVPAEWSIEPAVPGAKISDNKLIVESTVPEGTEIHVQAKDTHAKHKNEKTIVVEKAQKGTRMHFYKRDQQYDNWNFWSWTDGQDNGTQAEMNLQTDLGKAAYLEKNRVIVRKRENGNDWAKQTKTYVIPENTVNAYIIEGDDNLYTSFSQALTATNARIRSAMMDSPNHIVMHLTDIPKDGVSFELWVDNVLQEGISAKVEGNKVILDTSGIAKSFDPTSLIEVKGVGMFSIPQQVTLRSVLDGYFYDGDDMGVTYHTAQNIQCKLWAPTACKAEVMVYDKAQDAQQSGTAYPMELDKKTGVYTANLRWSEAYDKYYLYRLTFKTRGQDGKVGVRVTYAVDPYAEAVGLNGTKGYFVDIEKDERTIPQGYQTDKRPALRAPEDSIIYEMHVRDFTIDEDWGGEEKYRGKYLGIIQEGTTFIKGQTTVKTGLDHLKELGITHVHLLPTYDIASVNETVPTERNWGYDPLNYNAPEGSYATDAADPIVRIKEYREMVMGLHKAGIRVVLDQVYNHMASTDNMNNIVPDYYFRTWEDGTLSNGSGCGNEVASERPMVRKFIVDSNLHWVNDYKVDGLRFDLMALLDKTTMNEVKHKVQQIDPSIIIYGEPWKADASPLHEHEQTTKNKGISAFNDTFRDALRGNNDPSKGFVNGAISTDNSKKVQDGLRGQPNTVSDPELSINYVEAHDNYAIWDQIIKNEGKDGEGYRPNDVKENALENWKVKKAVLANGFVLTAQGIPFFQGGSEILRTKNGDHNSYKSDDETNDIDWADKAEYKEVFDYYAGLIKLRKEHPAFRINTQSTMKNHQDVYSLNDGAYNEGIILQHLKNNANGDKWANILVIYNGTTQDQKIKWLPASISGKWNVVVEGGQVSTEKPLRTIDARGNNPDVMVLSSSIMVLYDAAEKIPNLQWDYLFADQSTDYMEPMEPKSTEQVTVRFRAATGEVTHAKVHWYDAGTQQHEQMEMQKVSDTFYTEKGYDKDKVEFWEAKLPASSNVRYYNFEVRNENATPAKVAWISGGQGDNNRGVTANKPSEHGFSIVPDFQTADWAKESVFYQIMVDRFRDGDKKNNRVAMDVATQGAPSEIGEWGGEIFSGNESDKIWNNQFFGGDLIGVQEAIPYLKDILGVDALYLMPIFQSGSDHKYDIDDYNFVDQHFGGNQSLIALSNELHEKNMRLVLDGVFNHTSTNTEWFAKNKANYYFTGDFVDKSGKKIDFYPWHGFSNLAKLNYSKQEVKDAIYQGSDAVAKRYLKAPYNIDGWRLDAAEDVNTEPRDHKIEEDLNNLPQKPATHQTDDAQKQENLKIWQEFRTAVNETGNDKYILGEFWGDENQWFNGKAWDGKMNYGGFMLPFIENCSKNPWLGNQSLDNKGKSSVADIGKYTRNYFKKLPYAAVLNSTNSISTHDKPRFLNREYTGKNNNAMMELAAALQMTYPGIPMIYYGDEIGMAGRLADDPYNRGTFEWNTENWNKEMLRDHHNLIAVRKENKQAFVYGAFEEICSHQDNKYIVYARYGKGEQAIVVLNNHGSNSSEISLTNMDRFGLKDGDVLIDVLGNAAPITIYNNEAKVVSKNMSASVYVKQNKTGNTGNIDALKLGSYDDPRTILKPVENVQYKVNGKEVTVTWDAYANYDGAKEIVARLYDQSNKMVAQEKVSTSENRAVLLIPDSVENYHVAVKVCADREQKNDGYLDSPYTEQAVAAHMEQSIVEMTELIPAELDDPKQEEAKEPEHDKPQLPMPWTAQSHVLQEVPEKLLALDEVNTVEKITAKMQEQAGITQPERFCVMAVKAMGKTDSGDVPVTPQTFHEEGVPLVIPYPEGTTAETHTFVVTQMFTEESGSHHAGELETLAVKMTDKGLEITLHGLPLIGIGWTEK